MDKIEKIEFVKNLRKPELLDICNEKKYPEDEWKDLNVKDLKVYIIAKHEQKPTIHNRLKRVQRFRK